MASGRRRVAGAPITWGVCEVPDWGVQLPPDRVLGDIAQLGLTAIEAGPEGFLPSEAGAVHQLLDRYGLGLVGGFVPAPLHLPERRDDALAAVQRQAAFLGATGAELLILAAATGSEGYATAGALDADGWRQLVAGLKAATEVASHHGLVAVLHPHYGTMIERGEDVERLLNESDIDLCLDIGHLLVGGADPVAVTRAAATRVRHVHLKDVNGTLAEQLRAGDHDYRDAVAAGLYEPLGRGDVDIATIVRLLDDAGYDGWYVLEQDTVVDDTADDPDDPDGPAAAAAASLGFLAEIDGRTG
ncbi:sugar phosphate isomerase/epimerase family protein [Nitriliruptor alkaliphilus]|uniref:sugar phosphate isomerase/epimerase family protein n=1 Tax=Nitriliruptor alkaliphilus TaxID=427918 RepID=UPI000697FE85|nr:sugar phosphate isomerase/epimerase [Nitriliruptor alkaliphilus]